MILALETGWLPGDIASLPARFRAACHWVLFVKAIVPDGLPSFPISKGMSVEARLAATTNRAHVAKLRGLLFPDE